MTDRKVPGTMDRITMAIDLVNGDSATDSGAREIPIYGEHNVVTSISRLRLGQHLPVLDLDVPHELVPSSTPGHSHLYIDVPMTWDNYVELLDVLAKVGVIERGFAEASKRRGYSTARLPWIKKED